MKFRMNFILIPALACLVALPINSTIARAQIPAIAEEHVKDEVIVGYFDKGTPAENTLIRGNSRKAINATAFERISPRVTNTEVVKLGRGVTVEAAIARLKNQPGIRFVEPNYIVRSQAISNDPYFTNGSLWGMYGSSSAPANQFGSNAANAWTSGYVGSSDVVVGVIDEGIQVLHPDLAENIWVNLAEKTGRAGGDDDGNGYIDDINGWDFVNNNSSVYDGGSQDKHGTHVAGTIGARGNATGVVGVNWNTKIISAKFLGPNGGSLANAVKALDYLIGLKQLGANIVASNNSWGGGGFSQTLLDAINRAGDAGILFIAAAGNNGLNIDSSPSYPASYQCVTEASGATRSWDCIISVAAIDKLGAIASFSNYGSTSVDIGAPGVGIWSTLPGGYGSYDGTSMATPHVTGAVALCSSVNPGLTADLIKSKVISTFSSTSSLSGKTSTGGRLNVGSLIESCKQSIATLTTDLTITNTTNSGILANSPVTLTASGGSSFGMTIFSSSTTGFSSSTTGCKVSNNVLTVSIAPVTCLVNATRTAAGGYEAKTLTSPASFAFVAVPQAMLTISTSNSKTYAKGTTGITLQTSGGSGTGAVTYTTTNANCKIASNKLTVATTVLGAVSCPVTATKAASGIYSSALASKTFNFK